MSAQHMPGPEFTCEHFSQVRLPSGLPGCEVCSRRMRMQCCDGYVLLGSKCSRCGTEATPVSIDNATGEQS